MPNALFMQLPTLFGDSTRPRVIADPMLTAGTLALVDPMHPNNPWPAGANRGQNNIINVAEDSAIALTGAPGGSDITTKIQNSAVGLTTTASQYGIIERSVKGGLHTVVSQALALPSSQKNALALGSAIVAYVQNNPTHTFYASLWYRMTRAAASDQRATLMSGAIGSNSHTNLAYAIEQNQIRPTSTDTANFVGSDHQTVATNCYVDSVGFKGAIAGTTFSEFNAATWGRWENYTRFDASGNDISGDKMPSWIFYRYTLIDLTVTGKSYATMKALDYQMGVRDLGTTGGRYTGDQAPTNPPTIP